jgi:uncharacterized phage-associated protein
MAGGREFDWGRLKELVLFVSQESAQDEGFGLVKLNKLLYRADTEAYRLLGASITGETYEKQDYGPVARHLPIVLDELGAAGRLDVLRIPSGEHLRKVPKPRNDETAQPDMSLFTEAERELIERALAELAVYGGKSVSEWSHREAAGWRVAGIGDEISYESSLIARVADVDPEAKEKLRQRVLTNNWD